MRDAEIAIIGAGFTGTALAIELARRLPPAARIALVGHGPSFAEGIAYGTRDGAHRLNVPADRMSLVADEADDFVRWLGVNGAPEAAATDPSVYFAPRMDYRRYIADRLAGAERTDGVTLDRVAGDVRAVRPCADGMAIECDGGSFRARAVALCLGNTPGGLPLPADRLDPRAADRVVVDPWSMAGPVAAEEDDVVLVGTGLTMVDQVMTLAGRGHRGRMIAISRRGLVPAAHAAARAPGRSPVVEPGTPLAEAVARVRRAAATAVAEGGDWRAVVDGLRPVTQEIWDGFDAADRCRFLRHVAPYWGVVRHRMAPQIGATIAALRTEGRLRVVAARLAAVEADGARLAVRVRLRGRPEETVITADRVVNCAGLDRSVVASRNPVVRALLDDGLARADPIGLGFEVDEHCRLVGRAGTPAENLYALGPPTVGRFWECVAVPEIRAQCRDVAATLAGRIAVAAG